MSAGRNGRARAGTWLLDLTRQRFTSDRHLGLSSDRDANPVPQQPNECRYQERPGQQRVEQYAWRRRPPRALDEGYRIARKRKKAAAITSPADEITPPVSPTARALPSARPISDSCSRRRETR